MATKVSEVRRMAKIAQRRTAAQASRARAAQELPYLLMAAPVIIWIFIFSYLPMFGLVIAFKDYRFDRASSAVIGRLREFPFLARAAVVRISLNTLFLNSLFIVTTTIVRSWPWRCMRYSTLHEPFYQSALFFLTFISWVIVGTFVFALLNTRDGLVNRWLVGLGFDKVSWYRQANTGRRF